MDVKLVVQRSGQACQTFQLRSEEMIIGRQKGCGVRIPSAQVSRQHCLLAFKGELLSVEDLASANGTFINGRRIDKREVLRPGDKLKVGPITMIVQYQLTQAAFDRLVHDEPGEEVVVSPIEEVEVLAESGGGAADVELVEEAADEVRLVPDQEEEEIVLTPEEDPLEALRAIEAKGDSAGSPPKPKRSDLAKTKSPVNAGRKKPPPPPKRAKVTKKPAAVTDEDDETTDAAEARPDASLILGTQNWELPTGEDIRDILSQIEKGKKK